MGTAKDLALGYQESWDIPNIYSDASKILTWKSTQYVEDSAQTNLPAKK
jgi:hypothetical protein